MERIWDKFVTARDKQIFGASGFAQPVGFGERPALVIVDVTYAFCGDKPEPLLDSVTRWPFSSGDDAWSAIRHLVTLIDAARRKRIPIFYTVPVFRYDAWDAGSWLYKGGRMREEIRARPEDRGNRDGSAVVEEVAPHPADVIVHKIKPSGFHGTPLRSLLQLHRVDTLIMTGGTTSGCLRATVVDGFQENFRVAVAEDCCFDRSESSHAINLMDMNAKYADVLPTSAIVDYIARLPNHLFELPSGR